jgi:hypothetical protein
MAKCSLSLFVRERKNQTNNHHPQKEADALASVSFLWVDGVSSQYYGVRTTLTE